MQIAKKGVREQVYDQLKDDIVALRLTPGTMVSENELAARLGVSRMPVHDSLMALSQNHLVDIYPQRGSRISLIDLHWVEEAHFIRRTLEIGVTVDLFRKITQDQLRQLQDCIELQRQYMKAKQVREFFCEDNRFHRMLYLFDGKEETYHIVADIMIHFDRIRTLSLKVHPNDFLVEEHEEWLHLIEKKDAAAVDSLITKHLGKYREHMDILLKNYTEYFSVQD